MFHQHPFLLPRNNPSASTLGSCLLPPLHWALLGPTVPVHSGDTQGPFQLALRLHQTLFRALWDFMCGPQSREVVLFLWGFSLRWFKHVVTGNPMWSCCCVREWAHRRNPELREWAWGRVGEGNSGEEGENERTRWQLFNPWIQCPVPPRPKLKGPLSSHKSFKCQRFISVWISYQNSRLK